VTDVSSGWLETNEIADDANVLITIATSEAPGMIRRWGALTHAIGELSVEALLRGAVDDAVLELLRTQRPQQHSVEEPVADKVREVLHSGYRVFVRDTDDPIDRARAGQIPARTLLSRGHSESGDGSFYVLHLTVEPFGPAGMASHGDDAAAAVASDALRHDMAAAGAVAVATESTAAIAAPPNAPTDEYAMPALAAAPECVPAGERIDETAMLLESTATAASEAAESAADEPASRAEVGAAQEPAPEIELYQAQPKRQVTKSEALMEQFRPKVAALDFRGLFVGNFGFQRDTVVDASKLSALSPQTISAYLMKANSLRQSGDHEKALSYYRVLLKADPDNADYRFLYGKTLIEMGRIQPARECFERASELGHENAAHELERLENREAKKPALGFLQFWRRAEVKR